jgi:sigma-E factor negative regulatory protein RseA
MSIKDIEERESQLSAMYDGELPQAECELVARRLSRDENLRRSWENYALIGAAMRSEQMAGHRLAPKVAAAISRRETAESGASGRSARSSSTWSRWAVPLGSAGLAASIAVIGVLGMFWLGGGASNPVANKTETATASTVKEIVIPAVPQDRTIVVASASPASRARVADVTRAKPAASSNAEPESYVTPPLREGGVASAAPAFELASYVGAHSTVSAPMMRHLAISAVIATPQQAVAVVPMSEAPR